MLICSKSCYIKSPLLGTKRKLSSLRENRLSLLRLYKRTRNSKLATHTTRTKTSSWSTSQVQTTKIQFIWSKISQFKPSNRQSTSLLKTRENLTKSYLKLISSRCQLWISTWGIPLSNWLGNQSLIRTWMVILSPLWKRHSSWKLMRMVLKYKAKESSQWLAAVCKLKNPSQSLSF